MWNTNIKSSMASREWKKQVAKLSTGIQKAMFTSWHSELEEKLESLSTHS